MRPNGLAALAQQAFNPEPSTPIQVDEDTILYPQPASENLIIPSSVDILIHPDSSIDSLNYTNDGEGVVEISLTLSPKKKAK